MASSAADHLLVERVGGQLVRVEVAQVLVDPVGGEAGRRSARPTTGCAAMSARQDAEVFQSSMISWSSKIITLGTVAKQPADLRVAPRLQVELGVLVEAHHLVGRARRGRSRGGGAGTAGPSSRSCRRRPGRRAARSGPGAGRRRAVGHQPAGVGVQRVRRQAPAGGLRRRLAARAEDQARPAASRSSAARVRITGGGYARVRPPARPRRSSSQTVYALAVPGAQALDDDERVVVPVRGEGRRGAGAAALGLDPHGGRLGRLDPDGGAGAGDPPQQRDRSAGVRSPRDLRGVTHGKPPRWSRGGSILRQIVAGYRHVRGGATPRTDGVICQDFGYGIRGRRSDPARRPGGRRRRAGGAPDAPPGAAAPVRRGHDHARAAAGRSRARRRPRRRSRCRRSRSCRR